MSGDCPGFVAALDVGTTTLRCHVFNDKGVAVGKATSNIKLLHPDRNRAEINPDALWLDVLDVIKSAVSDANVSFRDVKSFGISTQRATFLTWTKRDLKPLHNFVTWKDLRAADLVKEVNKSWKLFSLRTVCQFVHVFTRLDKFKMVGQLNFSSAHVTIRLLWMLRNDERVRKAAEQHDLAFGTLDTWLVGKLTGGGRDYVTDLSNASATGLFDPTALSWSVVGQLVGIPADVLPPLVDNDYDFGEISPELFGAAVKIGAVMADQSASMYGSCSFNENDLKLTLGTGAFLNVNTADRLQPCLRGMYPLLGWRIKGRPTYVLEVPCSDAGSLVQWTVNAGLINDPDESSSVAEGLKDNGGVYFVPAFSGLSAPIGDETAASGFVGVTPGTSKGHLVRAVLESIAFRTTLGYETLKMERNVAFRSIKVDGGVSKNDFVCQMLADLTGLTVQRLPVEMSALGAAYVAGLSCDFWKTEDELSAMVEIEWSFEPTGDSERKKTIARNFDRWQRACRRFAAWYDES